MKLKLKTGLLILLTLLAVSAAALAADPFRYAERSAEIFEGETLKPELIREGSALEEGTLTFRSTNEKAATVDAEGNITAVKKGNAYIRATLKIGRRTLTAQLPVKVLRKVTAVTLNTGRMQVYRPEDSLIFDLLRQDTTNDVILLSAGKSIELRATVTPADASSKKVEYSSSDEGVLKVGAASAKAMQAGECDLTLTSVQNPEVTSTWHVLVVQPARKVTVSSPSGKILNVGESITLTAEFEPYNTSIQAVTWSSRNPEVATVDENGTVTGLKRGTATIKAEAADGSGKADTISLTVAKKPTGITFRETELYLATGQNGYVHATVLPQDANEKGVTFSSSDPDIATVTAAGQVRGVRRGECEIIATSKADPSVTASLPVQVVQKVTKIEFTNSLTIPVRTSGQLTWDVLPADATIKDVTFTSSNKKVATVDQNGVVTGYTRGTSVITATATDGSKRRGTIRVTVTQPVEGMHIQYQLYHVQLEGSRNVKAVIEPSNANNLNVHFSVDDPNVASVRDSRNIARVRGLREGTTILTGVTEDGGFTGTTVIRVADYNRAVVVDDLYLEGQNIRMILRNRSDFPVEKVVFQVDTYDEYGDPLVCNADGASTSFIGSYRMTLNPDEETEHYYFNYGDWVQPIEKIGTVTLTVLSWTDSEGYTWNIGEEHRPNQTYRRYIKQKTSDEEGNG